MSEAMFKRTVAQCNKYAKAVEFGFFGEQLLHPQYDAFLLALKNRNFKISVNTNLSLCSHKTFDTWRATGVDEVRLSLDASSPEVYNKCRPGAVRSLQGGLVTEADRFSAVNEKVAYWLALKDHKPTRLVYVKSSFNPKDKQRFIKIWRPKLGPRDHILFKQVVSYGGKIKNSFVQPYHCNVWDKHYLVVGHNGDVSPCNLDVNLDLCLGNISNKSVVELYTAGTALREKTGCGKNISPCRTCVDSNNWSQNEEIFN